MLYSSYISQVFMELTVCHTGQCLVECGRLTAVCQLNTAAIADNQ